MTPWTDRTGRVSALKLATFLGVLSPFLCIAVALWAGALGPRPLTEAIHQTGDWAVRFLLLSLAVTPLRRLLRWPRLILIRRQLGLAALGYVLVHLTLYSADQNFALGHVASEIVLRIYLLIGFVALTGLAVLGATSTDAAIRRLRRNWNRLHKAVYGIGVLALIHFFLQSKIDVSQATVMAGLFLLLMGYRVLQAAGIRAAAGPAFLLGLAAGPLTAGLEALWFAAATGVPPLRILMANLDFSYAIRPAWWVLGSGLAVAAITWLRQRQTAGAAERPMVPRPRPEPLRAAG